QDGKSTFSEVVRLNLEPSQNFNVTLLGNPVADQIRLQFSGVSSPVTIYIKSLDGHIVYMGKSAVLSNPLTLAVSLNHGIWFLEAWMGGQKRLIPFIK
ncbi:MAG: hypothetical protein KGM98_09435, partial [Bacteroidota bacterium]|nr:hypothetical protein [Bacteroidota bacterium]